MLDKVSDFIMFVSKLMVTGAVGKRQFPSKATVIASMLK